MPSILFGPAQRAILAQESEQALTPLVGNLIRTGVVLISAIALYWIALRIGRRLVAEMASRDEESGARAETLWLVGRRVILIAVFVTATLIVFDVWDFSIAPFLAVGTVLAAAIGFGAQDLVKDVIAGFFILVEDQFHVGDTVTIADTTGMIEDIQLRVTVLRDFEGRVHYVPNGQIKVASNFTSHYARPVIDVGVAYESDVDRALEIFKDELSALASDPEWSSRITGEAELFGVNALDDSAVVLRGRLTTAADHRWTVRREALRRVKNRFDAEGVTIPFPQVTIHKGGLSEPGGD